MYEQGSFEPVARVVQLSEALEKQRIAEKILYIQQHVPSGVINQDFYDRIEQAKTPLLKIYHYHCNHLGTPQELTNQDGDVIWLSYDRAWGGSFDTIYKQQFIDNFSLDENELQPIKFQGQSLDVETGLHYNRFRYYDSDVGMFISRDPIGLLGGNNVFQYAPNPIGWIDPWGLSSSDLIRYKPNKATPVSGARQTAIDRAWRDEKALVQAGGGSRNWSQAEKDLILNTKNRNLTSVMSNAGYTGHHINSVKGNGKLGKQWRGDPRNIVFLQNDNHPSGIDEHLYSNQGHRGNYQNNGKGRLIDRKAMLKVLQSSKSSCNGA